MTKKQCQPSFSPYHILLHSMIGYWHNHVVRLSICMSVCNAVCCGSQGRYRLNVVSTCSKQATSYFSVQHFCCSIYLFATKRTDRNKSNKTRTWVSETNTLACTGRVTSCYSRTIWSVTIDGHAWVDRVWVRS